MSDRHPTETLSAYLDGEVTNEQRDEVARHLEMCEGCRALLDDFRMMASAAAQEPAPPAPSGLAARILAATEPKAAEAPAPEPRWVFPRWLPLPVGVAAGVLLVATASWVVLRPRHDRTPVNVAQAGGESRAPDAVRHDEAVGQSRPASPPPGPQPKESETLPRRESYRVQRSRVERDRTGAKEAVPEPKEAAPRHVPAVATPPPAAPSTSAPGLHGFSKAADPGAAASVEKSRSIADLPAAAPEPDGRSIQFDFKGTRGTLAEAGFVTLALPRGACSADLSAAPVARMEVRSLFELVSLGPSAKLAGRVGESKESERSRDSAGEAGATGGAAPEAAQLAPTGKPVTLLRLLSSTSQPLQAGNVDQIEERLRHLLEVTAGGLLESRCGVPAPRPPAGD